MQLKIMTFNMRHAVQVDGINYFPNRTEKIRKMLLSEMPDLIGFQEADDVHRAFLKDALAEYYTVIGCGREKDYRGESVCVAFRKDAFELVGFEHLALSFEPNRPGSAYVGTDQSHYSRSYSHTILSHNSIATPIHFFNTHLDHRGIQARTLGMAQIMQKVASSKGQMILTGDMNARPNEMSVNLPMKLENRNITDATAELTHTFHGFGRFSADHKIDYIFSDAKAEKAYIVEDDATDGVYYSDHYAVCAVLDFDEN